ncbi:uncharacterized protein DS421_7g208550 [Arachis hypogaea]|nr:uncharacterized protein DS421_7g208550 [Arachis hypogaea]
MVPPRLSSYDHDGKRHEGEHDPGRPELEVKDQSDALVREGRRKQGAGLEPGRLEETRRKSRNWLEEGCGPRSEMEEVTSEVEVGGLDEGLTPAVEVIGDENEGRLLRKGSAINAEPVHIQRNSCNLDDSRRKRLGGVTRQGTVGGLIRNCNIPEADRQIRGLEEGEILLDGLNQNGNGHEEERENSVESGSEIGDHLDDGRKPDPEEERPSWEEEMAENKAAWKLAVKSGA